MHRRSGEGAAGENVPPEPVADAKADPLGALERRMF